MNSAWGGAPRGAAWRVSGKAVIGGVLGRFIFRDASVQQVRDLSPRFRWLVRRAGVGAEQKVKAYWSQGKAGLD